MDGSSRSALRSPPDRHDLSMRTGTEPDVLMPTAARRSVSRRETLVTWLTQLAVGSPVSYLLALLVPALDAVIFVLPSETAVIALGVATAGSTDPRIGLLVALAAAGAFLGDNGAYWLGSHFGPAVGERVFGGARGAARRAWAERVLHRFGARIIVGCRFIPGGRTAVTVTCGLIGYPRRSFVPATACAGVLWAGYAFLIGRLGGRAFEDRPWAGLLLAVAAVAAVSMLLEGGRRARRWYAVRKARREPADPVTYGSRERPARAGAGAREGR
jgi:membrane-associated protein